MNHAMNRCTRCQGRKKIFKINSGYSYINSGGIEIDCPMCLGKGNVESFENSSKEVREEVEKIYEKIKAQKLKEKDFNDENPKE